MVAKANWSRMNSARQDVLSAGLEGIIEPRLGYQKVDFERKKGVITGFSGGPRIVFREKFQYGSLPPWGGTSIFTFTTKMSCPSYSLPAGPPALKGVQENPVRHLGTCPASLSSTIAAQRGYQKFHEPVTAGQAGFICDICYAGKSRYLYPNMKVKQMAVLAWTVMSLENGSFVEQMVLALRRLHKQDVIDVLAVKNTSVDFFRIHDAGDFYSIPYYHAWCDVIEAMPDVSFWAPTRMWVFPGFLEAFRRRKPANLSLRPSALTTDALPPRGTPMSAGTMVNSDKVDVIKVPSPSAFGRIWPCPAYESKSEHNCASAPRPDGTGDGCRTCWGMDPAARRTRNDFEVSYPNH
jgi:hypothetical protein